jgi:hypothetical protein
MSRDLMYNMRMTVNNIVLYTGNLLRGILGSHITKTKKSWGW